MDFTVVIVGLLIGVGIPLRNKAIRAYRKKKGQWEAENSPASHD